MVSQRRLFNLLTALILLSLFAVACERPLGGTDDGATEDQTAQTPDPNAGGGVETPTDGVVDTPTDTTGETTTDEPATDTTGDTATDDTATDTTGETTTDETGDTTAEAGDTTQDDSAEAGGGAGDATTDTTGDTATEDTTTEETTTEDTAAQDTSTDTATTGTIPATHTVAAGENLYRIGLKYGISWVAIANANNLANPNILRVGQVLTLPGSTSPGPTPSPGTESTYVVQPGDNLYRIGLKFGISWVQIAEANGLVNPNVISVGDELKIPVDTPGPAPAFSHVVRPGETLFLISLQYGVSWPSIAEANNLTSPYVIYVGQTLEIPGS
jgi:LysM repeat protein